MPGLATGVDSVIGVLTVAPPPQLLLVRRMLTPRIFAHRGRVVESFDRISVSSESIDVNEFQSHHFHVPIHADTPALLFPTAPMVPQREFHERYRRRDQGWG